MTCGDPAVSVAAYYISTERRKLLTMGTGELIFRETRFQTTLKALASVGVTVWISDAKRFLSRLVGSYSSSFAEEEDLEPCMRQLMLAPVREALSRALKTVEETAFNDNLARIAAEAKPAAAAAFAQFGLGLEQFRILGIHIPDAELNKIANLERQRAEGTIRTENEYEHLQKIWGGKIGDRTLAEALTGIPSRGYPASNQPSGGAGGAMTPMMQMAMMMQMLPQIQQFASENFHTDLFGGAQSGANGAQSRTSSAEAAPGGRSRAVRRCPVCNSELPQGARVCPVCGKVL